MAPPVHSRYLLIDSLRGLASFWILCLHVLPFTGDASGFWPQLIEFGRIGTDFFFVTSGYLAAISCNKLLLKEQPTPWFTFSKSRFKRIFAIYWFSLIFAIVVVPVVCALLSYFKSGHLQMELFTLSATELLLYSSVLQVFTAQSWQLNTAFSELNGVYWFIAVLLQIYL